MSKGKSPDVSSFLGGLDGGWRKARREGVPVGQLFTFRDSFSMWSNCLYSNVSKDTFNIVQNLR